MEGRVFILEGNWVVLIVASNLPWECFFIKFPVTVSEIFLNLNSNKIKVGKVWKLCGLYSSRGFLSEIVVTLVSQLAIAQKS